MVEQRPFKSLVLGSNPSGTTNFGVGLRRFDSVVILADVQQPIWTRQDNCHQGSIPCAPSILLTSFNPSTRLIAQWKSQPKSPSLSDLLPKATKTVACWPKSAARWTTMRAITNTLTLQHLTVTNVSPNWPCALQSPLTLDAFNVDFHREFLSLINEAMPPLRDHKRNRAVPILFWSADTEIWILDHCHFTNEFRGYICNNCNLALGRFNDDEKLLRKAIDYLKGKSRV